jgi:hypothetical protein
MLTAIQLRERLITSNLTTPDNIVGCSDDEISELERATGGRLPRSYREFLKVAGKRAGPLLSDTTAFYPKIIGLTQRTRDHFSGFLELPPNAFVFANHMGEAFLYFEMDGNEDPPAYGWDERYKQPQRMYDSIWGYFEDELKDLERLAEFRRRAAP